MATRTTTGKASYADLLRISDTKFQVHTAVYNDPKVFADEMIYIFEKTWVYIGHASEVAEPGDYRTGRIGRQPIIITRGKDKEVHVLLNVCRHRANAVCREERGNSFNFRCPYHAWVYQNTGELIGVSDRPRYSESLKVDELGLMKVPRVAVYRGLIFASLSDDGPSFDEHIGDAKRYLDTWVDRSLEGEAQVLKPHRYTYQGNWKFQCENGVDGYHPGFVHESAFSTYADFGIGNYSARAGVVKGNTTRSFPGGHTTLEGSLESGRGNARSLPEHFNNYRARLIEKHGETHANDVMTNRHLFIFPNIFLFDELIRVIQPISLEETEIASYPFRLGGVPDEFNARRLYEVTRQLSTTGLVNPSDLEMFAANQTGLRARNMEWLILMRGMEHETVEPSGERRGEYSDEVPQRGFYRHWLKVMGKLPRTG